MSIEYRQAIHDAIFKIILLIVLHVIVSWGFSLEWGEDQSFFFGIMLVAGIIPFLGLSLIYYGISHFSKKLLHQGHSIFVVMAIQLLVPLCFITGNFLSSQMGLDLGTPFQELLSIIANSSLFVFLLISYFLWKDWKAIH